MTMWGGRGCTICIYIYIWYPPKDLGYHIMINVEVGRWGSKSEIDGMGLRVGGFRVSSFRLRI